MSYQVKLGAKSQEFKTAFYAITGHQEKQAQADAPTRSKIRNEAIAKYQDFKPHDLAVEAMKITGKTWAEIELDGINRLLGGSWNQWKANKGTAKGRQIMNQQIKPLQQQVEAQKIKVEGQKYLKDRDLLAQKQEIEQLIKQSVQQVVTQNRGLETKIQELESKIAKITPELEQAKSLKQENISLTSKVDFYRKVSFGVGMTCAAITILSSCYFVLT